MSKRYLTKAEHNAILAGLRLLQAHVHEHGHAGVVQDIFLDGIEDDDELDENDIDNLCDDVNFSEVQFGPDTST